MTRVNVHFLKPEPWYGIELNAASQVAWDRYEACEDDNESSELWDLFIETFELQVRDYMGYGGAIEEVYEDYDD